MTDEKKPEWLAVRGETSEEETLARLNWLADVRRIAVEGEREQWIEAAKHLAAGLNEQVAFPGEASAKTYIREYFFQLLEADDYLSAAALAWRRAMFDPRPRHTRRIFAALRDYDLLLIVGAAGLGKTYAAAAWTVMDFIRDPRDTAVKFASVQQTNLEGNLWAKIRALLSMALFSPVSLDDFNDIKKSCRIPDSRPDCGMDAIFLGRASEAQGKLKGYHPEHFRPKTHPLFGDMTRVRILLDECLPYHIPVLLADGRSLPIGEIVEKKMAVDVLSYDTKTKTQRPARITGWSKTPNRKPLVKINAKWKVANGWVRHKFVVCTIDHKVWTENRGWVEAGFIVPGDIVQVETTASRTSKYKMTTKGRRANAKRMPTISRRGDNGGSESLCLARNRGGNGRGPTPQEEAVFAELPVGEWEMNYVVPLGKWKPGYPKNYKIDIANPECKIGIEIDGHSHYYRRDQDEKKEDRLRAMGWRIFRFSNSEAWRDPKACADKVLAVPQCPIPIVVTKVSPIEIKDMWVYDIHVEDTHCFYGNGILVHNCQNIPEGVKEDFGSPRSSVGVHRCMKIIGTANPTDASKWALRLAEPTGGWTKESMERLWEWDTAEGWHVCRVDASKFENVIECRNVFSGIIDHDAQKQHLVNGIPTKGWYVYYKGWPPPGMSADVVVPAFWFDGSIGTPVFTGPTVGIAGVDPSFVNDPPFIAVGRKGTASGWIDSEGVEHHFESRKSADGRESRQCAVVDDLITLNPNSHTELAKDAVDWCRRLQIESNHVVVDMTGTGYAVFTEMTRLFGTPVIGVNWKNSATDGKILAEDRHPANIQVVNIRSEMYWTARNWIQPRVRGFFINPVCKQRAQLRHQLTTTTYDQIGGKQRIEDKEHWKSRNNGNSPNEADAVVQMIHAVRERGHKLPALSDENASENAAKARGASGGYYDTAGDAPADTCDTVERIDGDMTWERPNLEGDAVRFD